LEEGAFVVEGARLAAEAVRAGWRIEAQFIAPGGQPIHTPGELYAMAPGVAERVSDLETAPGLFAVVARNLPDPGVLARAALVVVADRVGEPGNLGTIVRSAEAAGADAVVVTPGTVDETNPKVVRASAGALFHVPVVAATLGEVTSAGLRLIGSSSHRGSAHTTTDWSGRIAIVAGNESAGLDADAAIDQWVCIEHRGRAESLNVAMATTVLCFEALRQRTGEAPTSQ
jgi:RNA methyltransferase, TrmH family